MKQYNHLYSDIETLNRYIIENSISNTSENILIQLFTSHTDPHFIQSLIQDILKLFPFATLVGSSTAGEIIHGKMVESSTILGISVFEETTLKAYHMRNKNSYRLGEELSKKIFTSQTKCVISFLDGLEHNGQEFLDGLSSRNNNGAVIAGGMAADGVEFEKTYTICNEGVFHGGAVCVAFEGEKLEVHEDYNLGWKAVGPTFRITKSDGARVYEINNRPIVDIYAEVLGSIAVANMPASTIEFPLIKVEQDMLVARSMLHLYKDGSILYAGNLEEGEEVRFGLGSRTLVNRYNPNEEIVDDMQACFVYSCVARKEFLGKELESSFRNIERIVPSIGFFTYGEFYSKQNASKLLNISTTLLFLKEKGTEATQRTTEQSSILQEHSKTDSALFHLLEYMTQELYNQEQKFRTSKFKLDEFLKALDATVIISRTDTAGIITYVNERFEEISGYSREELIGQPHSIVRDPSVDAQLFRQMWRELQRGNIWRGEFSNRAKDGSIYYVKSSIIPIHDENQKIIEYMAIREDVTSLVESRKKAQKAEAAQSMFLANMSHEIRTPMNGILGFSELLEKTSLDEKQQKYLNVITSSTKLLLNIVNDILDSSKISNEKIVLESLPIDPFEEFATTFELLKSSADEKNLEYKMEIDSRIADKVLSDAMRLRQVLSNLLSNAIKFTAENGSVVMSIALLEDEESKQRVRFSVKDTGIGINASKLKTIFEPFSQADISTTRKFGGTGLGLSISSDLVKAFGSELRVESKEGEGTLFYFDLEFLKAQSELQPVAGKSEGLNEVEESCDDVLLELLIAEDYEVNRMLIESLLEKYANISSTFVKNGLEAIDALQKKEYDLILMDINMPIMNGIDATKMIRNEMNLQTPIVALTANVLQQDREKFLSAGMDDYLSKPIEIEKLEEILCRYSQEEQKSAVNVNLEEILESIKSKIGISKDISLRLIGTFLESVEETLPQLEEALAKENVEEIYAAAHKIKGAAATLYISDVEELFKFIEDEASHNRVAPISSELDDIRDYMRQLKREVASYH